MDQWGLTDEHESTAARWIRTAAWGLVIKLKDPEHGIDLHPDSIEVKATIGGVVFHVTSKAYGEDLALDMTQYPATLE